jgi:hypothetical protein
MIIVGNNQTLIRKLVSVYQFTHVSNFYVLDDQAEVDLAKCAPHPTDTASTPASSLVT